MDIFSNSILERIVNKLLNEKKKREVIEEFDEPHETSSLPDNVIPLCTYKKDRQQSKKDELKIF